MNTKEYNGWTNYETWLVKLWMDNDEGSQAFWREASEVAWNQAEAPSVNAKLTGREPFTRSERARLALADTLKEKHEETCYESIPDPLHASFIMDLLNGALQEVNWHEIAECLLNAHCEDYGKEAKEAA